MPIKLENMASWMSDIIFEYLFSLVGVKILYNSIHFNVMTEWNSIKHKRDYMKLDLEW